MAKPAEERSEEENIVLSVFDWRKAFKDIIDKEEQNDESNDSPFSYLRYIAQTGEVKVGFS